MARGMALDMLPVMHRSHSEEGFSLIEMLVVVALVAILSSFAIPQVEQTLAGSRLRSQNDAVSGLVGLAKMRATALFTRARVNANLGAGTYRLETYDKATATWVTDGGVTTLPFGVSFGVAALTAPPTDTQLLLGQSDPCPVGLSPTVATAGTACITFNSRGIPIDSAGSPIGGHAFYLTDGAVVRGVTVTATPLVRRWWSPAHTENWVQQ